MNTEIKELKHFKQMETNYITNFRVLDDYTFKRVYVIFERDDEYGYRVFRDVAFRIEDAYSIVKEKVIQSTGHLHMPIKYNDWLLVDVDERVYFHQINGLDEYKSNLGEYEDTDYRICIFNEHSKETNTIQVWASYSYIETGEQQ
jgi:hypothetical protein